MYKMQRSTQKYAKQGNVTPKVDNISITKSKDSKMVEMPENNSEV
jgi:hypothetical protein